MVLYISFENFLNQNPLLKKSIRDFAYSSLNWINWLFLSFIFHE